MRPVPDKPPSVTISAHAWQRWRERVSSREPKSIRSLAAKIALALHGALKSGMEPDAELAVMLPVAGVTAVIIVDRLDGWVVKTFLAPENRQEVMLNGRADRFGSQADGKRIRAFAVYPPAWLG